MADRSSGPVKPPVIDLTARTGARPEGEAAPGIGHRNDAPPRAGLFARADWVLLGSTALVGALLGTLLTYVLAMALPLPVRQPVLPPDLSAEVSDQGARLGAVEVGLADLQQATTKTQVSLDATIAQLDGDKTAIDKSIADLKASIPPTAPTVDLTPLETELKTLRAQVDAIAAGASGGDAGAIAQSLAGLETNLSSLATRLGGVDQTVAALRTDLDAARQTLTQHISSALPNEVGPALKLPLILSGLESAFENGRPFAAELKGLTAVLPDFAVPASLTATADAGLARPDALLQKFEQTLPAILGARDTSSGDWTQNTLDWAKSLLALRPAEEAEGTSPEAVASRLEAAMARRDYAAALTLIGQLPAPMQAAAAPVAPDIAAHAAADQLVADLRTRALSAAETTQ